MSICNVFLNIFVSEGARANRAMSTRFTWTSLSHHLAHSASALLHAGSSASGRLPRGFVTGKRLCPQIHTSKPCPLTWMYLDTGPLRKYSGLDEVMRVGPDPRRSQERPSPEPDSVGTRSRTSSLWTWRGGSPSAVLVTAPETNTDSNCQQ